MASIVALGSVEELDNELNVPLGVTQLQIHDVTVETDTTKLFLQGRIKHINGLVKHPKTSQFYRKVTIEEDETQDQMHFMLTVEEKSAEQFQFLKGDTMALGDVLVVVNVKIELDPLFPTQDGANVYQAIVNLSSPDCTVLLLKTSLQSSKHPAKITAAPTIVNRTVPNPKSQKKEPYSYIKIGNLVSSSTVNIFGVVKFVKDPFKTKGLDYSMVVSLVDDSVSTSNDKLKCVLFGGDASKLPSARPGNIIRFHRLKIGTFNNELQGQNAPGLSWVVFDGSKDSPLSPIGTSHENNTITEEDRARVRQLRVWATSETGVMSQDHQSSCSVSCPLSDITTGQYFDLVCQVVGTCVITAGESLLLKVWDGTRVKLKLYEQDMMSDNIHERFDFDAQLTKRAGHFLVDVWVFDDHFASAMAVKPRDFIKLQNLHALRHKPRPEEAESSDSVSTELCLHGGFSFGRRLTILDPRSKEVKELQQRLDRELAAATDDSADSVSQLWCDALTTPQNIDSTGTTNKSISNENIERTSNTDDLGEFFTPLSQPQPIQSPHHGRANINDIGSGTVIGPQHHAVLGSSKESTLKRSSPVSDEVIVKRIRSDISSGLENEVAPLGNEELSSSENDVVPAEEILSCSDNNTVAQSQDETLFSSENDLALTGLKESAETEAAAPVVMLHSPSPLGFTQDRCMLNTATVMTGHHHIKVTDAVDILKHTPPYKFRFQGFAMDYQPKSDTVSDFLRLYCDLCKYVSSVPSSDAEDQLESSELSENSRVPVLKRIEDEIKIYCCPVCNGDLEYIYMMEFILNDGTGWIRVGLWKHHAIRFFDCAPVDLLRSPNRYHEIVKKLNLMCFGQCVIKDIQNAGALDQSLFGPQKMECCLMSYHTSCGIAYQMFDTTFAVDS